MPTMKLFAENFFSRLGGQLYPGDGELVVDLPPELAAAFGQPRLYLVLPEPGGQPRELSPGEDLLVYGSRVFEQMLALLAGRGEATQVGLPACFPAETTGAAPLPLHHCELVDRQLSQALEPFYLVNFRLTYLSDEKQEEFCAVAVDAAGHPRPDKLAELAAGPWLPPDQPARPDPAALRRIVERAGEVAGRQAERRAAELATAGQPRLHKALLRLVGFYRRLAGEVNSGDPARDEAARADLQRDLLGKAADELERHRLRVSVTPLSYALVWVPMARYRLALAGRSGPYNLELVHNLHTGRFEAPGCAVCVQPLDALAICHAGHAAHPGCVETCCRCDRDTCRVCGIQACAVCGRPVCRDCTAACTRCQDWLCAAHVELCPVCGDACCSRHHRACRWCGQACCERCNPQEACATCRQALAAAPTTVVPPPIQGLSADSYQWRRAENRRFIIFIGQANELGFLAPLLGRVVLITDRAGRLVAERRFGLEKLLWGK